MSFVGVDIRAESVNKTETIALSHKNLKKKKRQNYPDCESQSVSHKRNERVRYYLRGGTKHFQKRMHKSLMVCEAFVC